VAAKPPLSVLNVGYRSTNYWLLSIGRSRLLVDLGWPGMFGPLAANLKRLDVPIAEVGHGLATHYHMDHAGLAEELKTHGMKLIVMESQSVAPPPDQAKGFIPIGPSNNVHLTFDGSRAFLKAIGLDGVIVPTIGHSHDSVSLVLDLQPADLGPDEQSREALAASWDRLRALGVKTIYPGHGPTRNFLS
jgi:ribonuclease/clavin/mitogillin